MTCGRARIVRATEACTSQLPGYERDIAPVYSLVLATEPLPPEVWDEIGLRHGETFSDQRHLIIYGQRTADDRVAFGGRGAPYHFGSRIRPEYDRDPGVYDELLARAARPVPRGRRRTRVTHRWGGPLGIPRDWYASVGLDPETGIGWGGGYVGDGVGLEQPRRPHAGRPGARRADRRAPRCRGSTTARRAGSPSRCAGSASTSACA